MIKTGSAGKDRILLQKGIILAIRKLATKSGMDPETRDLLAYIALSLESIGETIDESVAAWEKRGYWVKADRYRMEWQWTSRLGEELETSLLHEDWGNVARITAQVTEKLSSVQSSQKSRLGTPWVGAWEKLSSSSQIFPR